MRMRKDTINCRKHYSIAFILLAVCLFNSKAFSLDVMGPPVGGHEQGWFDVGIEYSNTKMDLDLYNGYYTDYLNGALFDWGDALDITMKDLKVDRTYARFGYGIADNAEVFLRLGGLKSRFGDTIWEDSEEFDSGAELAAGAGIKMTFYEEENLKLGGLFQFGTASFDGQLESPNWLTSDFVEVDMTEVQLALGASCKCNENLTIYGGPFLHFVNGSISDKMSELSDDPNYPGIFTSEFDWDIQEKSSFGGYIGAQINFNEQTLFNIEYQQTADARAFGMSLIFRF